MRLSFYDAPPSYNIFFLLSDFNFFPYHGSIFNLLL